MSKKNILLLTLVHPDFLPPVYATGQVLRDLGYHIHILTFDSFVPAELDLGSDIILESVGRHYDATTLERINLRSKFLKRAGQLVDEHTVSVISFCPFTFQVGSKIKNNNTPLIYIALEIADFVMSEFFRSPLSNLRSLRTFRHLHRADLVATPSLQRSAWLAGRCRLDFMPHTVMNTAYLSGKKEEDTSGLFKEIVPAGFLSKKIILYTGAVNVDHCILELVKAFDRLNNEDCALIITGVKDNEYCKEIKAYAERCASQKRIKLFPYVTRNQMLALQSNAHIGACLIKEHEHNLKSKMVAPNKAGEYTSKNLYVLGTANEYMKQFEIAGIASLAETPSVENIAAAIAKALAAVNEKDIKSKIRNFVQNYFCMQQQLRPVIRYIEDAVGRK